MKLSQTLPRQRYQVVWYQGRCLVTRRGHLINVVKRQLSRDTPIGTMNRPLVGRWLFSPAFISDCYLLLSRKTHKMITFRGKPVPFFINTRPVFPTG